MGWIYTVLNVNIAWKELCNIVKQKSPSKLCLLLSDLHFELIILDVMALWTVEFDGINNVDFI